MNKDRLKFRLWNKEAKQMFSSDIVYIIHNNGETEFLCPNVFGESHIMQCTGFKDKNDKLIYEGDIIENEAFIDQVVFRNGVFTTKRNIANQPLYILCSKLFLQRDNWQENLDTTDIIFEKLESMQIIGNIYE